MSRGWKHFIFYIVIAFGVISFAPVAQSAEVVRFTLHVGVIARDSESAGWIFHSDGFSRFYDTAAPVDTIEGLQPAAYLFESGPKAPKPDPVEGEPKSPVVPPGTVLFVNATGQTVALNLHRPTPVVRLGVGLQGADRFVLWRVLDKAGNDEIPEGIKRRQIWQDQSLWSFEVIPGTLEPNADPDRGVTFRPESGKEEVFSLPEDKFDGIPGLNEIGFRLETGEDCFYRKAKDSKPLGAAYIDAEKKYPGHWPIARIFEGEAKSRLLISVTGRTPVFRVILKIALRGDSPGPPNPKAGVQYINLWSN